MDDCSLEKLSIKPGKVSPPFQKDTLEYNATVGSNVEKVTFTCLASDTGASCSISGGEGGKTVPLKEGVVNDIKIEVTAEDGTVRNYFVHIRRLSAKDATLSNIKLNIGKLTPEFSADVTQYYSILPCSADTVAVSPTAPDAKAAILVDGNAPGSPSPLNIGATTISIQVSSPDGTNTEIYTLEATRRQIPRHVQLEDSSFATQVEDPISLSIVYQPITIKDSQPKHTFSAPILDELTRTSKSDPINETSLGKDWRFIDYQLDNKLSNSTGFITLSNGGKCDTCKVSQLGGKLKDCSSLPKLLNDEIKYDTNIAVTHTLQVRSWEKQLHQIFDETDAAKLKADAEKSIKKYYASIPENPSHKKRYDEGESPLDHLDHAAHCYATALKSKSKDCTLHLSLAMVLEERYNAEDILGLKKEAEGAALMSFNQEAKESSKDEECAAICKLRGVEASAPLSLQLKAIDEEYHHLLNSGQSGKADHVQNLFAWKSKQATQEGLTAQKASDEESPLGQAYLKYLDALSLDDTKSVHHFQVGRMLVAQGNYDEAVKRLEAAIGWSQQHLMARFYLGMALALKKDGPGLRAKECMAYLFEGFEAFLKQRSDAALSGEREDKSLLCAEELLNTQNILLLRGFVQLGLLLRQNPDIKDVMSAENVLHTTALLASQQIPSIHHGDTYQQLEWVLLDVHSLLLEGLLVARRDNCQADDRLIAQRCQYLSALVKRCTILQNSKLLGLQEKTCEMLVQIQPCDSYSLYLLGAAQLAQYDNSLPGDEAAKAILESAKSSFKASIDLEGKQATGEPPSEITTQKWWQDKLKQDEEKKKKAEAKPETGKPAKPGSASGRGRGSAGRGATAAGRGAARGGAAARGAATGRGAAAGAGRGATTAGRAVAAKGTTKAAAPPKAAPAAKTPAAKPGAKVTSPPAAKTSGSNHSCNSRSGSAATRPASASKRPASAGKRPASAAKTAGKSDGAAAPVNKKTYHARLGLARALAKNDADVSEAHKLYSQVIDMAPEVHDAYVESAEMMTGKDPMAAVDIYCKFPVSDNPTFDDAYIFGEIVRMLMKAEKFDDPRLAPNMIALGKVMGIGSMEKYVQVLDAKFKSELLKSVYAGVNGKEVDDPEMQAFFKFKCWI